MEDSEDANPNPVQEQPSLPQNYVTLAMLKERWLQRKKEEEEAKLKAQENPQQEAKDETQSSSKRVIVSSNRNQNRQEYVPRQRQQPAKDRRGAEGSVKKYEEPESNQSSASVVIGENQEIKLKKKKRNWRKGKPRVPENEKSSGNAAGEEEIPTVLSEERGGKGDTDNGGAEGGVSVYMVEAVSENVAETERDLQEVRGGERRGGKQWRGGFKRNNNRRNFKDQKQAGELVEKEKKAEEGDVQVSKDRSQNCTGYSAVKIDKSSQDSLLDDGKDTNVSDNGDQQLNKPRMNSQVGELGNKEKEVEEKDGRKNGNEGSIRLVAGLHRVRTIENRIRNFSLDNRKHGNPRMSGNAGGRQGYIGYRGMSRDRVENRSMWVKKGENSSANVTVSNSQVHP